MYFTKRQQQTKKSVKCPVIQGDLLAEMDSSTIFLLSLQTARTNLTDSTFKFNRLWVILMWREVQLAWREMSSRGKLFYFYSIKEVESVLFFLTPQHTHLRTVRLEKKRLTESFSSCDPYPVAFEQDTWPPAGPVQQQTCSSSQVSTVNVKYDVCEKRHPLCPAGLFCSGCSLAHLASLTRPPLVWTPGPLVFTLRCQHLCTFPPNKSPAERSAEPWDEGRRPLYIWQEGRDGAGPS